MTNLPNKWCRDVRFRRFLFLKLHNSISNYPYAVWLQFGWESRVKQEEGSWSVGHIAQAGVDFENWSQLTNTLLQDHLAINIEIQEWRSGAGDLSRNRISERYWGEGVQVCQYSDFRIDLEYILFRTMQSVGQSNCLPEVVLKWYRQQFLITSVCLAVNSRGRQTLVLLLQETQMGWNWDKKIKVL